jgi:AraC-like DNA-binding protein
MDVLSDVLTTVRLQSQVLGRLDLRPSWGITLDERAYSVFHVVLEGQAWFQLESQKQQRVEAGDVVLLPHGNRHALRDAPESATVPFDHRTMDKLGGRSGALTSVVCGTFRFEDAHTRQLFAALPSVLHVRELDDELGPWLEHTLQLIGYESKRQRPGSQTAVAGLCDALFVYLLRSHVARLAEARSKSWLKALSDPQVGAALALMHEKPEAPWTVPQLAKQVGMSRSRFAERFVTVVGRSPLQYLVDWRLQKAARLLRDSRHTLAQIASAVGYESEAAFNKAFKRSFRVPPGTYRERRTILQADATMTAEQARA